LSFKNLNPKAILSLSYAPDGKTLAVGDGKNLIFIHITSLETSLIYQADNEIYWIDWLPDKDHLLFLTGLSTTRTMAGKTYYGNYKIFQISLTDFIPIELYANRQIDVRDVRPSLCSDGKYLALIAYIRDYGNKAIVLSTAGFGIFQLAYKGRYSFPCWRPVNSQ